MSGKNENFQHGQTSAGEIYVTTWMAFHFLPNLNDEKAKATDIYKKYEITLKGSEQKAKKLSRLICIPASNMSKLMVEDTNKDILKKLKKFIKTKGSKMKKIAF